MKLNTSVSRIALSLALAFGVAGAGTILAPGAYAAEKAPTVSAAVGKPLQEAMNLLKGGKAKEAQAKAQEAAAAAKTPYEVLVSNQIIINTALKNNDYTTASKAIEAAIGTGQLQPADKTSFNKTLVQIYYQQKNYPKTIETAQAYLKDVPNDTDTVVLIGQSYYLQNDFKKAAETLHGLVKSSPTVKEDTLSLLMSADYKLNDDAAVRQDLEIDRKSVV